MKKVIVIVAILIGVNFAANAQPEFDDDVTDTPIDGGIILLTVASVAYGCKKNYKNRTS
jgi:hypothetical protein